MHYKESGIHKCACGTETIEEDGVCRICKAKRREKSSIKVSDFNGGDPVANVSKEKICIKCQKSIETIETIYDGKYKTLVREARAKQATKKLDRK